MQHSDAIDLARTLAEQFARRADEADRQGKLPAADVQALKESGYLAMNIPREYGGPDLSLPGRLEVEIERFQYGPSRLRMLDADG